MIEVDCVVEVERRKDEVGELTKQLRPRLHSFCLLEGACGCACRAGFVQGEGGLPG